MKKLLCVLLFTLTTALSVFAYDNEEVNNAVKDYMTDKNATCVIITFTNNKYIEYLYLKPELIFVNSIGAIVLNDDIKLCDERITDILANKCIMSEISYNKKTGILSIVYKVEN